MRLLHVINTMNPASGGTAEVVRLCLKTVQAPQKVASLDHSADPWIASLPGEHACLGSGRGRYGYSAAMRQWLAQHAGEFDALIVHGMWQHHSVAARLAARRAGVPYFVFPHGMMDPYFHRNAPFKRLKKAAYWPVERAVLRDAAAVLFTAEEEKELARATFDFDCTSRIVPLGVESPSQNPADKDLFLAQFPEAAGKQTILFLGRVHPKKGIEHLVEAFAQQAPDDWRLVIAGPPEDQAYSTMLARLVATHRLQERVTFTGMISGSLKFGALQAASVFALPSHQENFGLAVAEALAFGLPVLISDKVNIWREIEHDGAGWAAEDSTAGMSQLLGRWLAASEAEKASMAAAARACFERRFRAEVAAEIFLGTLRSCGVGAP
jgi:glycosyltransferase involved in cell wall biosynthesis